MFAHWTGLLDSVGCFLVAVEVGAEVGVVADFDCCFLVAAGAGVGVVVLAGAGVVADFDYCFLGCSSDSGCFVALAALAALVVLVVLVVLGALAGGDGGDDAGAVGDAPRCGYGGR